MELADLIAQLRGENAQQRAAAAEALAHLGEEARGAIPALVQYCDDPDEPTRDWCQTALETVGPPTDSHLKDLTAMAQANSKDVAYWAITLLGRAGNTATVAIPVIIERLESAYSPALQQRAAWALGQIGGVTASSALERVAANEGPLAEHAQRALQQLNAA